MTTQSAHAARDLDRVSISVTIPNHSIDMVVPLHTTVAAMMTDLVAKCRTALDSTGRDSTFLGERTVSWHLERFGGEVIDPEGTLDDAGISSGDRIYLCKGHPTEVYPELIDDHAEFIAQLQTNQFAGWSARYSRPLSAITLLICAAVGLIGLVAFAGARPDLDPLARYSTVGALLAAATLMIAITLVCDYSDDPQTKDVPKWGFILGYALLAAAAAITIPRALSMYTIVIVAVLLATVAVVIYASTKRYPLIHVTVASAALLGSLAPLLSTAYTWPPMVIAAQTMALTLIVLKYSGQMSRGLARINLPYIAASGESYIKNLKGDVSTLPLITSKDETLDSIFHQRERTAAARNALLAVTVGFCITVTIASFFVGANATSSWWLVAGFVTLVAAALVFRGLASDDAMIQGAYWIGATATILAFLIGAVTAQGITANLAAMTAAVILTALITVIVSIRQVSLSSNGIKRLIDIFEYWVFFTPFLILGFSTTFMGLFAIFRAW